jgi:hypothetical protein
VYRPHRPEQPVDEKMTERKRLILCGIVLAVLVAGLALYQGAGPAHQYTGSTVQPAIGGPYSGDYDGAAPGALHDAGNQSIIGIPAQAAGNGTGDPGPAYNQSAVREVQDSMRSWRFDVDTSTWPPDEYFVVATSARPRTMAAAYFCVAEPPAGFLQQALSLPAKGPVQPVNTGSTGISIDPIQGHYAGDRFAITGTTNLVTGDEILIVITPVSFGPTKKNEAGETGGTSGMATVLAAGPAGSG